MIELKKIDDIEDFKKIPEIQKSAWGFLDLDIEPHHLMTRVQKTSSFDDPGPKIWGSCSRALFQW